MSLNWLPLTEYSSKYQVSISTLRRRIKAEDIKYQFADGRYLILDQPQEHRPSPAMSPSPKKPPVEQSPVRSSAPATTPFEEVSFAKDFEKPKANTDESILAAANGLLTELKKAYTQILQEKEEQIMHLKEEQADLKTLIRVLEAENERLTRRN
jgi:hypothetical protein